MEKKMFKIKEVEKTMKRVCVSGHALAVRALRFLDSVFTVVADNFMSKKIIFDFFCIGQYFF